MSPHYPKSQYIIQKGDFIESSDRGLRSPRGIVVGQGTIGTSNIPAWKIRGPHGETTVILKSDARLIAKSEQWWARLAKRLEKQPTPQARPFRQRRARSKVFR